MGQGSQKKGYLFGGPHDKECSILGSISGSLMICYIRIIEDCVPFFPTNHQ